MSDLLFLGNFLAMTHFDCDYMSGAHPEVLEAICRNNSIQTSGYGDDSFCDNAKKLIREACGAPDADVQFLAGGTQTNSTVISAMLREYEGVIAAATGHIAVHEAGELAL